MNYKTAPEPITHQSSHFIHKANWRANTKRNKPLPTLTWCIPLGSVLRALLALIFQSRSLLMRTILGVPMEEAVSKPFQSLQRRGRALAARDLLVPCHLHTPGTHKSKRENIYRELDAPAPLRAMHVPSFLPAVFANHDSLLLPVKESSMMYWALWCIGLYSKKFLFM